jgi:tetratricopeptide (TPR) repeat protein
MRAAKHTGFVMLLLLAASQGFAQFARLERALDQYREKQLDSAKINIDSAAVHPQTARDYKTWMVRGFIYKDLYKTRDADKATSALRDMAVESFRKALALDTANINEQKEGVLKSLKFLGSTYHNDINKTLDTLHYQQSLANASRFVEISKTLDPSFNDRGYNFEVYLTLGSMFEKTYEGTSSKNLLDLAKVYLFKAHDIDSSSFLVNKNLGLLYYNQAVEIINKMDVDISLEELPMYQDRSVKLGKQALSYCLKAHALKPDDKVVVEALAGIYYLLNETEKHNEFKKKLELLNKQ